MGFQELTDEQWAFIAPLLPPRAKTGRPRVDDRKVLNGILYVLVTGCRWCDMPRQYGAYQTAWRRFRELQEKGIWQKILQALLDWKRWRLIPRWWRRKKGGRCRNRWA
jgi:transposase